MWGVVGGLSLIGPMLLMILRTDRLTALITTSVSTMLFALVVAKFAEESSSPEIMGITAAYAAVLVVFVGASH